MNGTPTPQPSPLLFRFLPGLTFLRGYQPAWLTADLVAGVSVCLVMIPSVIAYAGLMGIAPQHGLYAALVPLLVYTLFGSSRQMIVGPDIAISLLVASAIAPLGNADPIRAAALAALVAVLSGLLLLLGARAKIGAVADFLSKPVLIGYMTGAALILIGSQLDKLFGVRLQHTDFFPRLVELAQQTGQIHWPTLAFGAALLLNEILKLATGELLPELRVECEGTLSAGAAMVQAFDVVEQRLPVGLDVLFGAWSLEQRPALASAMLPALDGSAR